MMTTTTMPRSTVVVQALERELQEYFTAQGRSSVFVRLDFHNGVPYNMRLIAGKRDVDLRPK